MTDKYTIDDVYKIAGKDLTDLIIAVTDKDKVHMIPSWFYQSRSALGGKSPCEICNEGHPEKLEKMLMDILTAAQGG